MKALKKIIAVVIVLAIVCSFAFVFQLSGYSGHTHNCYDGQCVICSMINFADGLMRSISNTAVWGAFLTALVCLFAVSIIKKTKIKTQSPTPVTLKIKING